MFLEPSAVLQQRLSAESAKKTQQRYGGRHAGLQKNSHRDCAANRRPIVTLKLHEHCGKLFDWMNFR
jgi:hypothetical protein